MIEWKTVLAALEKAAPPALAEDWDNSGIQLHWGRERISRILVCLDLTEGAVERAVAEGVQLIVSHHPILFTPVRRVDVADALGRKVQALAEAGISIYAAHMTYDKAPWSNSASIAGRLGLEAAPLPDPSGSAGEDYSVLLAETETPLTGRTLAGLMSVRLSIPMEEIRYAGNPDLQATKVLICAGSGGDLVGEAVRLGCQALITGDINYHHALEAAENGVFLLDAGHFGTERIFVEDLAARLARELGEEAEILPYLEDTNPIRCCLYALRQSE